MKAIGIDFGGTTIKSGLVDDGKIIKRGQIIDSQKCPDPETINQELVAVIRDLGGGEPEIGNVGIGLPGIVDSVNGIVHELTNVKGWIEMPLRDVLQERTGLRV